MKVIQAAQRDEDHGAHQVGAIVHRDVGLVLQSGGDVTIIAVLVLTFDRIDRNAEIFHQAGRDIVLGRQWVGGAEQQIGAAGFEGLRQVGGLGGDVQAGRHPHPRQRLFFLEALADRPQNGHVALGPVDPFPAVFSQFEILDVTHHGGDSGRSCQFKYSSRAESLRLGCSESRHPYQPPALPSARREVRQLPSEGTADASPYIALVCGTDVRNNRVIRVPRVLEKRYLESEAAGSYAPCCQEKPINSGNGRT